MQKVRVDDIENAVQPAAVMRKLTKPLETTDLAINYYELEPGDSFAFAYHRHEIQEEIFYVQAGTATFETESGDVAVEAGEIVRFPPGEFQRGWNDGTERVIALALGAPLEYGEQIKLRDCPSAVSGPTTTSSGAWTRSLTRSLPSLSASDAGRRQAAGPRGRCQDEFPDLPPIRWSRRV